MLIKMSALFAEYIPALVGFLRALRFPPTPKNQNPSIFQSIVSGLTLSVQDCLASQGLIICVCAVAVTQQRLENPVGCKLRVTKTANYYYLYVLHIHRLLC